ncbi:hypothetical protein K7432_015346 [Basidiobolus ranarum]|uniref:Uncharacterized protein n=1 Tax=Basidiobolus ranarum TaxID=34480 RepID=A0ABR2VN73_9FUNG
MYLSSIQLLFFLSAASLGSGASVAERAYSPAHSGDHYGLRNDWNNINRSEWREDDEYDSRRDSNDYRRDNSYPHDYDFDHGDYEPGDNRHEDHHDNYRNASHHDEEDWDNDNNNEGSSKGRDNYYNNNVPSGGNLSVGNGSSNSGPPASGGGGVPSSQENVDPAAGNDSGETAGSKETMKPGNLPAGDATNIHEDDDCHRNLVDGRLNVLDIKAKVCLGLDLAGNILNNDRDTSSPGTPSGLTEGSPSGVPSGTFNGLPGGSAGDATPNGSNIPKTPGAAAGDTDSLASGTPGAPSPPGNLSNPLNRGGESSDTHSGHCKDIAVKVRQLLGINADAVVCLDRLIRVDTHDDSSSSLDDLLPGVLTGGNHLKQRRTNCEVIKAHADILGIKVDAIICLPEIVIRL